MLSPHKLIGGPGTPGVLVARRELFRNRVPTVPGGGTVVYVNPFEHVYLADPEHREEGGTPAIVESIRAGLAFQLKERVGSETHPRPRGGVHRSGHRGLERRAGHRHPRATRRCRACRSCRSRSATTGATSTTTSWSRCSTTCSASSRAAAARAPDRTAIGCSASTSRHRTPSSARSPGAARASSPAGSGSTSTTSSARRCSTSSSGPSTSSPARAGGCCRGTASMPATGLWRHGAGSPEPPLSLHDIRYGAGRPALPGAPTPRAGVAAGRLPGEAERILADPAARPRSAAGARGARRRHGLRVAALVLAARRDRRRRRAQ